MATPLLPIQQPLPPPLPTIEGNVDYRRLRQQLLRIDQLLIQSGIEQQFIAATFEDWKARCKFKHLPAKAQRKIQIHARRALRCNIARTLLMKIFGASPSAWRTARCSNIFAGSASWIASRSLP